MGGRQPWEPSLSRGCETHAAAAVAKVAAEAAEKLNCGWSTTAKEEEVVAGGSNRSAAVAVPGTETETETKAAEAARSAEILGSAVAAAAGMAAETSSRCKSVRTWGRPAETIYPRQRSSSASRATGAKKMTKTTDAGAGDDDAVADAARVRASVAKAVVTDDPPAAGRQRGASAGHGADGADGSCSADTARELMLFVAEASKRPAAWAVLARLAGHTASRAAAGCTSSSVPQTEAMVRRLERMLAAEGGPEARGRRCWSTRGDAPGRYHFRCRCRCWAVVHQAALTGRAAGCWSDLSSLLSLLLSSLPSSLQLSFPLPCCCCCGSLLHGLMRPLLLLLQYP